MDGISWPQSFEERDSKEQRQSERRDDDRADRGASGVNNIPAQIRTEHSSLNYHARRCEPVARSRCAYEPGSEQKTNTRRSIRGKPDASDVSHSTVLAVLFDSHTVIRL
jgi:hypothetical protein